jgi:hypothetical protein
MDSIQEQSIAPTNMSQQNMLETRLSSHCPTVGRYVTILLTNDRSKASCKKLYFFNQNELMDKVHKYQFNSENVFQENKV